MHFAQNGVVKAGHGGKQPAGLVPSFAAWRNTKQLPGRRVNVETRRHRHELESHIDGGTASHGSNVYRADVVGTAKGPLSSIEDSDEGGGVRPGVTLISFLAVIHKRCAVRRLQPVGDGGNLQRAVAIRMVGERGQRAVASVVQIKL